MDRRAHGLLQGVFISRFDRVLAPFGFTEDAAIIMLPRHRVADLDPGSVHGGQVATVLFLKLVIPFNLALELGVHPAALVGDGKEKALQSRAVSELGTLIEAFRRIYA